MNNPINREVFDSRDLIEYKEYLEEELVDFYNDYLQEHNQNVDEDEQMEDIESFGEVDTQLEGFYNRFEDEINRYETIETFCEELESSADFIYGETIIHEDYFTEYCEEFVKDCGYISDKLPSFIEMNINWEGVADDLRVDYMEVEFEGNNYFIRS